MQFPVINEEFHDSVGKLIQRPGVTAAIERALHEGPICLMIGARQTGKTTLARTFVAHGAENYFDLEDPVDLARLAAPRTSLGKLEGLIVIDEVQRHPDLFPVLRVLVDRPDNQARFLILGSASPTALRQSAESLAGRVTVVELGGLDIDEVGADHLDHLWLRGGYPRSYLADDEAASMRWRANYIRTLATRDLADFGVGLPAATVERFLTLVAHRHAQLWTAAPVARALGISETTCRKYLDALADAMIVRVLQPWHANIGKRQIRSPKTQYRDSGIAHLLLGISDRPSLMRHPLVGASWEALMIEQLIASNPDSTPYFWRTSNGAELDLLLVRGTERLGYEIKRADAPTLTRSMRIALSDLQLDHLTVVYPGDRAYELADNVTVTPAVF